MSEKDTGNPSPVRFTEDRIPLDGIEEGFAELVELYGGEVTGSRLGARDFALPMRRGMASSGAVECTIAWTPDEDGHAAVTLTANRNVDAPRAQRILMLLAGAGGAVLFMLWPFFPGEKGFGTLAGLGGVLSIAVYLMTLRKTGGGIAYDFLQRLAARQRAVNDPETHSPA